MALPMVLQLIGWSFFGSSITQSKGVGAGERKADPPISSDATGPSLRASGTLCCHKKRNVLAKVNSTEEQRQSLEF